MGYKWRQKFQLVIIGQSLQRQFWRKLNRISDFGKTKNIIGA